MGREKEKKRENEKKNKGGNAKVNGGAWQGC
jgi:hypothetical protein